MRNKNGAMKGAQRANMEKFKYATSTAFALMKRYGLSKWSFAFLSTSNGRDRPLLGQCQYKERKILLNPMHVPYMKREEILDTILHEIAHALTSPTAPAHGAAWRAMAVKLGANPDYKDENIDVGYLGPWVSHCSGCKGIEHRFSTPDSGKSYCGTKGADGFGCGGKLDWRNVETGKRLTGEDLDSRMWARHDRQQLRYFLADKQTRKLGIPLALKAGIREFGKDWGERIKRALAEQGNSKRRKTAR